jgi:hypothetical protein
VAASSMSAMPVASSSREYWLAATGAVMAASNSPSRTPTAAPAVELLASVLASGRFSVSQVRTWASACGWLATVRTSASPVPGRTSTLNRMGSTASATATSGSPSVSASMVAGTAPSTEFSTGTQAASTRPARTAARVANTVVSGISSSSAVASERVACSVNVPCGPKYAMRGTASTLASGRWAVPQVTDQTLGGRAVRPSGAINGGTAGWPVRRRSPERWVWQPVTCGPVR